MNLLIVLLPAPGLFWANVKVNYCTMFYAVQKFLENTAKFSYYLLKPFCFFFCPEQ